MLTVLIGLVGMFMIYMSIVHEAWGVLAITIIILLFLMIGSWNEREDWKAYRNWRDYWARGGDEAAYRKSRKSVNRKGWYTMEERPWLTPRERGLGRIERTDQRINRR